MTLEILATNRLRVPYNVNKPPTLMINGYMLQACANVDLPSSQFSGSAATWYVFAVRADGSDSFTLAVNTSSVEAANQRLIGEAYWDGSNVVSTTCYLFPSATLAPADYDSGWFACAYNNTYTKAHGLGATPRMVIVKWSASPTGSTENAHLTALWHSSNPWPPYSFDSTSVYIATGDSTAAGTIKNMRLSSASGYYRIYAWK